VGKQVWWVTRAVGGTWVGGGDKSQRVVWHHSNVEGKEEGWGRWGDVAWTRAWTDWGLVV